MRSGDHIALYACIMSFVKHSKNNQATILNAGSVQTPLRHGIISRALSSSGFHARSPYFSFPKVIFGIAMLKGPSQFAHPKPTTACPNSHLRTIPRYQTSTNRPLSQIPYADSSFLIPGPTVEITVAVLAPVVSYHRSTLCMSYHSLHSTTHH